MSDLYQYNGKLLYTDQNTQHKTAENCVMQYSQKQRDITAAK